MPSIPDIRYISLLMDQDKMVEAGQQLDQFLEALPWHAGGHMLMARWCEAQNRLDDALQHWREARAVCPDNAVIEQGLRSLVVRRVYGEGTAFPRPGVPSFQDLDKLIEELESARIIPNPDIPMMAESDMESDIEDAVSETLARIYAHQNYFEEAARVYEKLAEQKPDRAEEFRRKAGEMRTRVN